MSQHDPLRPLRASRVRALTDAARTYNSAAWLVSDYLERRGISDRSVSNFALGVVTDPIPGHEPYVGRLAIPYLGVNPVAGEVECWHFKFRCMEDHSCKELGHGKYTAQSAPTRMFNVRAIEEAGDEIHVTEGELDAVILNQCGFPAVAIPGANSWKWHYARLLAGFDKVFIWGDPDGAGADFVTTVLGSTRNSSPVRLTLGDVNETYLRGGLAALQEAKEAVRWE